MPKFWAFVRHREVDFSLTDRLQQAAVPELLAFLVSYKLGLTASQVVRLIGLLLVNTSHQKNIRKPACVSSEIKR